MSIAKMQKAGLIGLYRQRRQILDFLQGEGVIQISENSLNGTSLKDEINYDAALSDLEFAISFLGEYQNKKEAFLESFAVSKKIIKYKDVKRVVLNIADGNIIKRCQELEGELVLVSEEIRDYQREIDVLLPWISLNTRLNSLKGSKYVCYRAGTVPKELGHDLCRKIENLGAALYAVSDDNSLKYIIIAIFETDEEAVDEILAASGFNETKFTQSSRKPADEIENLKERIKELIETKKDLEAEAGELAVNVFNLMMAHDYFLQKKEVQGAEKRTGISSYTFNAEGWIKRREFKKIQKKLSLFFPESIIFEMDHKENEDVPVAIENLRSIIPFEAVTGIYGLPSYGEVDPTPLLATFFILFFGLCLGDAGYGITLSIVALVFYKKAGPASSARGLLKLLMFGGIVTFIAGAVTGGWFGVDPADFPKYLEPAQKFLLSIRIIDPVKNPIGMLVLALSFGIIQVVFGIFVDFYIKVRDHRYLDAILDDLLWIYFLLSLVAIIVQKTGTIFFADKISYFALTGALLLVLTQGRSHKNILLKLGSGILSLYKTVGYLSDVLSYSRILALGLATSIIAMVINMVAMMTKDSVPVLGYIIMIVLLIGGHIFNLAVNVLGAFIHSSRLQFVEFFSKFMEGGGTEFSPLRREGKYTRTID